MPMRVFIPKDLLKPSQIARAIENALDGAAKAAKVDFKVTTQTWGEQPEFSIDSRPGERIVGTDNQKYDWVNNGTKPHPIEGKRSKRRLLTVYGGFRPKSRPGYIGSNKGSKGKVVAFRRRVQHPGTKPRNFDTKIAEKWNKELGPILQRSIDSEVS